MPSLLLIEDEATLAKNVQRYMQRFEWDVEVAGSAEDGLARVAQLQPDIIVIDFQLPGMDGLAAIATLRERDPQARIVMLTGQGSVQLAVDAMKAGAADFLTKPVELAELKRVLDKLSGEGRMRTALAYYQAKEAGGLDRIIGASPAIAAVKTRIRRIIEAEATDTGGPAPSVLVTGETGCGKELVARACHFESRRRNAPFIEVNCAAIPANLLETELFGYERGAFTDARERKTGLIEAADGGTLFLDEIGESDAATQAKLLKVLEDQRIRRIGAVQERRVDVRIIAATNRDLAALSEQGHFRADLLYRLRVIQIDVPPLRDRHGDVALLANAFLAHFAARYTRPSLHFTPDALRALEQHDWPGNVRELRNLIEQTVLLAKHNDLAAADLAFPVAMRQRPEAPQPAAAEAEIETVMDLTKMERDMVVQVLERTNWNVTRSARILGISRDTLRYRMEKHGLQRSTQGASSDTDETA
jgi:DNA-binding NtrC family response regulator